MHCPTLYAGSHRLADTLAWISSAISPTGDEQGDVLTNHSNQESSCKTNLITTAAGMR